MFRVITTSIVEKHRKSKAHNSHKISLCDYDTNSHTELGVEKYFELANRSVSQLVQAAMRCIDDHQTKKEGFEVVGE